ncbi:uncharacterized protein CELE_R03H10.11 [Caenorhabditis elegans]|uniref:Uncharacterized protein n=1 Tax=Caenorhabditis elegans TaxID=6239 RepID=A0A2C9C3D4_CAEEL|nr:Uncharacterized protein CELE_R03H10.11 [Caenorhabditis elegans]SOF58768.1 Uncharacterized protein CELE_R03H10.11 [Caenorhabditis elegans]|eukprot:NP_001343776.1 Uncharacterized protein CELE_R03H10.11 [Caenorhabditis elegans]
MAPISNAATVEKLIKKVADGDDIVTAVKSLAVLNIPLKLAVDLQIVEVLTPLSSSPLLNGPIHEILKKLEGKREKENSGKSPLKKKTSIRRVSSTKGGSKKRRSSLVTKKIQEVPPKDEPLEKENCKTTSNRSRLFKKNEPTKKDSSIWKRIKNVQA